MRHPHTGTFSTMWNITWAASDRGETRIWILGVWCETGPEWRWDAIRQTLMEVRWDLGGAEMQFPAPRMRWGGTCMKVRPTPWALDRGEMGPAWSWDAIFGTWMAVRRDLHGGEACIGETWILGPGCRSNRTWVMVRHTSQDLDGDDTRPGWMWEVILRPEWGLDKNLGKFMEDRSRSRDLDQGERWPEWRCYARDAMLETWMELSHKFWYPDGAQFDPRSGLECKSWKTERGWGVPWMVLGRSHGKLGGGETPI